MLHELEAVVSFLVHINSFYIKDSEDTLEWKLTNWGSFSVKFSILGLFSWSLVLLSALEVWVLIV